MYFFKIFLANGGRRVTLYLESFLACEYFTAKYNMQSYVGHGYEVMGTKGVRQL